MSRSQELAGMLAGIKIVAEALVKIQNAEMRHLWSNSSVRVVFERNLASVQNCKDKIIKEPGKEFENVGSLVKEAFERGSVVTEGLRQYVRPVTNIVESVSPSTSTRSETMADVKAAVNNAASQDEKIDLSELDVSSITLKELETILSEVKQKKVRLRYDDKKRKDKKREEEAAQEQNETKQETPIISSSKPANAEVKSEPLTKGENQVKTMMNIVSSYGKDRPLDTLEQTKVDPFSLPELSSVAKQRKVPSSRIGRVVSFGNLFAGLGLGTVTELTKGMLGLGGTTNVKEAVLSPDNTERIVDTLCKVRGAALKLGQILSIQDSNVVSPQLVKAFDRVRQAADYMPDWQVEKALVQELGGNWRDQLQSFEQKPFAAASIGQVHRGVLLDGTHVAIKIQYPGVGQSIESDIDNLVSMLKVWDVFPKGMFIDNVVKVAKRELAWEVDYSREADYTERFAELIAKHPEYRVPKVIKSLSTSSILTTELAPGVPIDQCFGMDDEHRQYIARVSMKLCLLELFAYRCMQTDPNWSNFLYDPSTKQMTLIDFGATRFYSKTFIDNYLRVILAAARDDRKKIHELSKKMGFLTGYETATMVNAHIDAVMILGEVFSVPGEFDFGHQDTTKRIAELVPVMVAHRLCPPPDEIYSLHRKISGIFLLCYRLNAKLDCKPIFDEIVKNYKFDDTS